MIQRGEIYFVNLNPTLGHEQAGRRPVLVVSSNIINNLPLVIVVIPGTKSKNISRDYAVNVRVSAKECGLPEDTVFLCPQIRSLDYSRFQDAVTSKQITIAGRLSAAKIAEVENALRIVLEL
jgi:mRNA interferase MazF